MRFKRKSVAFFIVLLFVIPCTASAWQGKVVGVSDGDTITVMHDGRGEKIRLYGVDCPESHQDFGQKAKKFTSGMVFGKVVDVESVVTDRYGRTVGLVKIDGKYLSEEIIRAGLGWVYTKYCNKPFCSGWKKLEEQARQNKTGLWTMPNPIPPWEFRRNKSSDKKSYNTTFRYYSEYHGDVNSKVFHRTGCKDYNCISCTATFKRRDEAMVAGYRPCGYCKP